VSAGQRNEAFDCRVYAQAALESLKYTGFDLDAEADRIASLTKGKSAPLKKAKPKVIKSNWLR